MTSMDRPVIAGIDGSPASLGAVHWAADEAVRLGQPLQITHALGVVPGRDEPAPDDYEMAVRAAVEARAWQPGIHVTTCTWQGGPAQLLVEQSRRASLVVVGSRGPDGVEALPVGSIGVQLAAHSHCPVLVVHNANHWAGSTTVLPQHRPVLVGMDGSDHAQLALELAFAEAVSRSVDLIAIRAWHEPPRPGSAAHRDRLAADIYHALTVEVDPWRSKYPQVQVLLRCVRGRPAPVLLAESRKALMIVLSPRGAGGFGELRLGSVTQQVLDHASAPVLVARR